MMDRVEILREQESLRQFLNSFRELYTVSEMSVFMNCTRPTLINFINGRSNLRQENFEKAIEFAKRKGLFGNAKRMLLGRIDYDNLPIMKESKLVRFGKKSKMSDP
jgi:hypothetical protein